MKALRLVATLAAVIIPTGVLAQTASNSAGAYVVMQGTIGSTPTTILLNTTTGKTWFLGQVDDKGHVWISLPLGATGSAMWIPLRFAAETPPSPPR